jgi:hypothetical protein
MLSNVLKRLVGKNVAGEDEGQLAEPDVLRSRVVAPEELTRGNIRLGSVGTRRRRRRGRGRC